MFYYYGLVRLLSYVAAMSSMTSSLKASCRSGTQRCIAQVICYHTTTFQSLEEHNMISVSSWIKHRRCVCVWKGGWWGERSRALKIPILLLLTSVLPCLYKPNGDISMVTVTPISMATMAHIITATVTQTQVCRHWHVLLWRQWHALVWWQWYVLVWRQWQT